MKQRLFYRPTSMHNLLKIYPKLLDGTSWNSLLNFYGHFQDFSSVCLVFGDTNDKIVCFYHFCHQKLLCFYYFSHVKIFSFILHNNQTKYKGYNPCQIIEQIIVISEVCVLTFCNWHSQYLRTVVMQWKKDFIRLEWKRIIFRHIVLFSSLDMKSKNLPKILCNIK